MAVLTPRSVFRRYEVDGVPASGDHKVIKDEVIQLLNQFFGVSRGGWVVTQTLAELNDVTPENETDGGVVLADPDPANNGYYQRDGGVWVRGRGFPDTFARVALSGSGSTQTGVVDAGVNPADAEVFFAFVETENVGPLTLAIGGEAPREVVNLAGQPLSAGEWVGAVMFALRDGKYQLLLDAGAAQAAAQSASEAEGFRDEAAVIVANADLALQRYVPVDVADVSGGDPATAYEAGDEVDGETLVAGWTVLRATPEGDPDDGIYVVPATGTAARADLFSTYDSLAGAAIRVMRGDDYASTDWRVNSVPGGTLGVTDILVEQLSSASDAADITYTAPLSGAVFRTLRSRLGERVSIRDFGGRDDSSTDNTAAMNAAADAIGHQGVIYLPRVEGGQYRFNSPCDPFTGPVKIKGDGRWRTVVAANGFSSGDAIFTHDAGVDFTYIRGAEISGLYAMTTNGFGALAAWDYVARSTVSDIWCEGLQDGIRTNYGWSNVFREVETSNNSRYGLHFTGETNQILVDHCIFDGPAAGARGVLMEGAGSSITFQTCSFEGFGTLASADAIGIRIQDGPFNAINVLGCYFENVAGTCLSVAVGSTPKLKGLVVRGNRFWGGHAHFDSQSGWAAQAIYLQNTLGLDISFNVFEQLETGCVFSAGNNQYGRAEGNGRATGLAHWNTSDTDVTYAANYEF